MISRYKRVFGFSGILCFFTLAGCFPEQGGNFDISISFANMGQAQTGNGIPQEVNSIRLTAFDHFGASLESECIGLSPDAKERASVSMDLEPDSGIRLEVQGWDDFDCGGANPAGSPPWFGAASNIVVSEGRQTPVVLQVRRMGNHLNLLRENLHTPRVFGTASYLGDDEVLVAGGFSAVTTQDGSAVILQAACNAEILDIASASVKAVVPMEACRGLHQAFRLSDGRVVLVGGSKEAVFDPKGSIRPVLTPKAGSLLQSVEIFDPSAMEFKLLSVETKTMRAMTAGAVLDDGTLLVTGGRTSTMRSSDVLFVNPADSSPAWQFRSNGMLADRAGARAMLMGDGLLIIGGNLPQEPDVELLPLDDEPSTQVTINGQAQYSLTLSGHAVSALGTSLIISGGIENRSGDSPVADLLWGTLDGGGLSLLGNSMVRPRAYHSVGQVGCSDGQECLVVFGGLDSFMKSVRDAELIRANSDGQLLPDSLETGSVGSAVVSLPDGSVLVVGGLDVSAEGAVSLSSEGQILTP